MHDIAFIRQNPAEFDAGLSKRGAEPAATRILALDTRRREAQTALQQAQSRRNEASKLIGQAMAKGDKEGADALKAEVSAIKDAMPAHEDAERAAGTELDELLLTLPNLPAEDVPEGLDDESNVEVARWGTPRAFDFAPLEHADLGPPLGLDFETGAAIAGARFTFLRGGMARLHRALGQFMLDKQTGEAGYVECNPPVLVRGEAMRGTGQLPKFAEDSFHTTDDRWLIPTAEVSLTNSMRDQIIDEAHLPIKPHRADPLLPLRGRFRGARHARLHPPAPVRKGRVGQPSCAPEDSEAEHERLTGRCRGDS